MARLDATRISVAIWLAALAVLRTAATTLAGVEVKITLMIKLCRRGFDFPSPAPMISLGYLDKPLTPRAI